MKGYSKSQPQSIAALFDRIAERYDLTNTLLSFGLHKRWNHSLVNAIHQPHTARFLDLCAGTGQIAFTHLKKSDHARELFLLDFSSGMLEKAKISAPQTSAQLHYILGDAMALPFNDAFFETITIAYGVRNIKEPLQAFREARRVLAPGGLLGILELTRPKHPLLALGHRLHLRSCLPLLGALTTKNRDAYTYLAKSIAHFYTPEELAILLHQGGFEHVTIQPLWGGIATLWIAS